ncbi:MAG: restriction endonuclease [Solirubrobacterales bacterium]
MSRFDDLSDLDFEELTADLMRANFGLPFRAGTRGRDAGVDVLAVDAEGDKHVVQCKHYKDSTISHVRGAAKEEAERFGKSGPDFASYRFVTSHRLNHTQREEIAGILAPWVNSIDDIYGEGDLRRLLREHPKIEGEHVKLWLAGAGPLQQLLNAAAYERSSALLEETRGSLPRFVHTEAFAEAREILRKERVCVIAGTAGVGKTTMSRLLMLDGLEEGFQPYEIAPGGLKDAWQLLALDERQLFYFDDFLGQTALHESRHHDAELLRFMRKIARTPGRRFVLATREYILRQARQLSEALDREAEDSHRFLLTIDRYSRQEKARIFYTHIYFSEEVDETAKRSLLEGRRYLEIIDHPGYNPRLIEWFTGWSGHELTTEEKADYARYCLSVLAEPHQLWSHAFEQGLSEPERALLISLLGLPRRVDERDAEQAFETACAARGIELGGHRFLRSLEIVDDSFLTCEGPWGRVHMSFINPSVIDFLRTYLLSSNPDALQAIVSAHFFEQVTWLWDALCDGGEVPPVEFGAAFGAAFGRTIQTASAEGSDWLLTSLLWNQGNRTLAQARLARVVTHANSMPGLGEAIHERLKVATAQWLSAIESGEEVIDSGTGQLLPKLAELGVIDEAEAAAVVREGIEAMEIDVDSWECLEDLHRAVPGTFSEAEWETRCDTFREYLDSVLDDPGAYLFNSDEVSTLEYLSDAFEAPVPSEAFDEARSELAVTEGEPVEPEEDRYEEDDAEGADFGESDEDIDAMFGRLG